jgi:hypothetical protein
MVELDRITPAPTDEEVAAIVAAIDAVWPRGVLVDDAPEGPPAWRFSGRWWRKPIAARRERPW